MALGVYIHIPYCLQRCPYCDFSTYEWTEILPPQEYVHSLLKEIRARTPGLPSQPLDTIYFGGGTPSLIDAHLIVSIIDELAKCGFPLKSESEVTIEINPATVDPRKLEIYLRGGINRFSVGAQTFDENLLKVCGRKHSAADTIATLQLLNKFTANFSLDILFALPGQTTAQLELDLKTALHLQPKHISPYCLTLPETHPMQKGRPLEDDQIKMFETLHKTLMQDGFQRYEISNYALPGFESRHNLLYWEDQNFIGFGLSAHSYLNSPDFGHRFWNAASIKAYLDQVEKLEIATSPLPENHYPQDQWEKLTEAQSLTDFCHTSLRLQRGLEQDSLKRKFSTRCIQLVESIMSELQNGPWIETTARGWRLTEDGVLASNQVFEKLTFLPEDIV